MSVVVPLRFQDRTLEGYRPTSASAGAALAAVRRFVAGDIANLVLAGPTGVGKSHLSAAAVNEIDGAETARYDHAVAEAEGMIPYVHPILPVPSGWLNVPDALVRIRMEFDRPLDDRDATALLLRMHRHRGVVVLDDLGREKESDWTGEQVYALVNARYESRLRTIVTTNATSAELNGSPYWPAISRLAEDGELVRIDAPDQRLAAGR